MSFVRDLLARDLLPECLAASAIEAEQYKLKDFGGPGPAAEATAAATTRPRRFLPGHSGSGRGSIRFRGRWLDFFPRRNCGLDEDAVTPNDGCGRALAGDPDLPPD